MRQTLFIRDDIILSLPDGPIGISFSGGADSTILLYLALKQLRKYKLHLFTLGLGFRDLNEYHKTSKVLTKVCDLTKNYNVQHHFTLISDISEAEDMFRTPYEFALKHNIISAILCGGNANPPYEVLKDNDFLTSDNGKPPLDADRSPDIKRPIKENAVLYTPLTNLNKQEIFKIYDDNGVLEELLPVTQSCWAIPECGKCWHCFERNWGLKFKNS